MTNIAVTLNSVAQTKVRVYKIIRLVQIELIAQLKSGSSTLVLNNVVNPISKITDKQFELIVTDNYSPKY